jgi:hypothetical protein
MGLHGTTTGNLGSRNPEQTTTGLFSEQTTVRNPTTNYLVTNALVQHQKALQIRT